MFKLKKRHSSAPVLTTASGAPSPTSPPPASPPTTAAKRVSSSSAVAPSPLDLAKESFRELLRNPTGNHHFRQFLAKESSDENIDFWTQVERFRARHKTDSRLAARVCQVYIQEGGEKQVNIDAVARSSCLAALRKPNRRMFDIAQASVFELMFTDSYRRFMYLLLQKKAQKELQSSLPREEANDFFGLGDCFCLTDPSQPDNPIVAATDGFLNVTGYSREDIVTRNCRFLQGGQTDPETVRKMGHNIREGNEVTDLLLNYKKDGTPFYNLLHIAPLKDLDGKIMFFLGGQVDVTKNVNNASPVKQLLDILEQPPLVGTAGMMGAASGESLNRAASKPALERSASRRGGFFSGLFKRKKSDQSVTKTTAEMVTVNPGLSLAEQTGVFLETYANFIVFDSREKFGTVKFVSNRFTEITGFEAREVVGRDTSFLRGPLTSRSALRELRSAMRYGQTWNKEIVAYSSAGKPMMSHVFLTPVKDLEEKPRFFVTVMKWREIEDAELEELKFKSYDRGEEVEDCFIQ